MGLRNESNGRKACHQEADMLGKNQPPLEPLRGARKVCIALSRGRNHRADASGHQV